MYRIGCDPEGFLVNKEGKPISSIDKIGGSKDFPLPVPMGSLQEDNVLIEFNTVPVPLHLNILEGEHASGEAAFLSVINTVKKAADKAAKKLGCSVVYTTEMEFSKEELADPRARMSGCNPDFNIYTRTSNEYPPLHESMRGAGGHIHIGGDSIGKEPEGYVHLLEALDLFVGTPFKMLQGKSLRDSNYGKYGNYRIKPYGIEYRTPSSLWVKNNSTIKLMYNLVGFSVLSATERTKLVGERREWISFLRTREASGTLLRTTLITDYLNFCGGQMPSKLYSSLSKILKSITF